MDEFYINYKTSKRAVFYISIIILTLWSFGCSVEANHLNENVNEKLISHKWLRDSYLDKSPDGIFENFDTKSELEFFSNGNLLIKESKSTDSNGTEPIAPPQGLGDTLIIYGKWTYFENTNTLTLKVDDSISQNSTHNYINWKLSFMDDNNFMIENAEKSDSVEILKVNFKSKI